MSYYCLLLYVYFSTISGSASGQGRYSTGLRLGPSLSSYNGVLLGAVKETWGSKC